MGCNHIGDNGCRYLKEGLENFNNLEKFSLFKNEITDIGCKSLVDALSNKKNLKSLDLSFNFFS